MKANTVLKDQSHNLAELAQVLEIYVKEAYKVYRIEKTLNAVVYVKGRANVMIKELFAPLCSAAVVIRRRDGSYLDPCDFGSYLPHNNPKRD